MKYQRPLFIFSALAAILMIPLVAMQFTDEVNWSALDFVIAGVLLTGAGFTIDLLFKVGRNKFRTAVLLTILVLIALVWGELAVGLFGTPFAGD